MHLKPRPALLAAVTRAAGFRFFAYVCFVAFYFTAAIAAAAELRGTVVSVSDGDTITVLDHERVQHRVRLAGIDAPEKRQAYGERARQRLAALVFGKDVVVAWHKRDRYGRTVGTVLAPACEGGTCAGSRDAGLALIEAGLAWHYKAYQSEQQPDERQRYAEAEETAKRNLIGLWGDANPVAPWIFRRGIGSAQIAPNPQSM